MHVIEKRGEQRKVYWQAEFKDRERKDSAGHFTFVWITDFPPSQMNTHILMPLPFPAD